VPHEVHITALVNKESSAIVRGDAGGGWILDLWPNSSLIGLFERVKKQFEGKINIRRTNSIKNEEKQHTGVNLMEEIVLRLPTTGKVRRVGHSPVSCSAE